MLLQTLLQRLPFSSGHCWLESASVNVQTQTTRPLPSRRRRRKRREPGPRTRPPAPLLAQPPALGGLPRGHAPLLARPQRADNRAPGLRGWPRPAPPRLASRTRRDTPPPPRGSSEPSSLSQSRRVGAVPSCRPTASSQGRSLASSFSLAFRSHFSPAPKCRGGTDNLTRRRGRLRQGGPEVKAGPPHAASAVSHPRRSSSRHKPWAGPFPPRLWSGSAGVWGAASRRAHRTVLRRKVRDEFQGPEGRRLPLRLPVPITSERSLLPRGQARSPGRAPTPGFSVGALAARTKGQVI